jgi:hypothetical protein
MQALLCLYCLVVMMMREPDIEYPAIAITALC